MYGELFKSMAHVDLTTVNYRGSAPAMPDLFAGRVQVLFEPAITAIAPVLADKVRALGVTSATRIAQLPDVPSIGEYVPGYVPTGWQAICAPKDTPPQIIATLDRGVNGALSDPGFRGQLALNSAHIFGPLVPVEEPSTASEADTVPFNPGHRSTLEAICIRAKPVV